MSKRTVAAAALTALALLARGPVLADDDGDDDEDAPRVVRAQDDVSCRLTLLAARAESSTTRARLVVRNRGRRAAYGVQLSVFANAPVGTPLWTRVVSLRPHQRKAFRLLLDVPPGAESLVAFAEYEDDDNPGNNYSVEELEHDGEDGGNLPPPANASALAGGATYSANCASCHGATGDGTQLAPRVTDRSAHSLLEAMREGEDGMPRFPGLTATDAANIAAYLADPSAATQPETPVPPADPGTTPTWTGQIKTLLQANCTACHSGTSAAKKIRFDGYLVASQNAAKALAAMQAGTMPPGGPLPAESVQLFADWIAGGKPQ